MEIQVLYLLLLHYLVGIMPFPDINILFHSKTSASERALVFGLGGLNFFGVIVLGTMLKYDSSQISFSFSFLLSVTSKFF